ncbi:hypothetical protein VTN77DRAFT_8456 [Rasamsonia byssochlamydoides]|uniref:uncharacterized protein n=1 Tax=Rasamsonia byssochlamydoides TaxID=89139 RepID=UPI0037442DCA
MVGTPRSAGCETCRRRKKKCGEERPSCRACVAAGQKCPGYARQWKFVDETQQLASQYRQKRYIFEDMTTPPTGTVRDLLPSDDPQPQSGSGFSSYEEYHLGDKLFFVGIFRALTTENDRNGAFLMHIVENAQSQLVFPLRSHGSYFRFIPARLGRNLALDEAVSCLCAMYDYALVKTASSRRLATRRYVRSLEALRCCLQDMQLRLEPETICASILLQLCELLTNADNGRWNHLSRGTKILIQERGPAAFAAPFERAMLESQRAFFIAQAVHAGERCFLSEAPWRELLRRPAASAVTEEQEQEQDPPSLRLRSQLCDFLVDILDVVFEGCKFSAREQSIISMVHQTDCNSPYKRILLRLHALHRSLEEWYVMHFHPHLLSRDQSNTSRSSGPEEIPTASTSTSTCIAYPDIVLAVLNAVSNTALVMLEQVYSTITARCKSLDLDSTSPSTICTPATTAKRAATARTSLDFVRRNAPVAAQPLEFGLKQLLSWSNTTSLTDIRTVLAVSDGS